MSKKDSQPNLLQRINVGLAAGIVALLALTATVLGIELYGLNGITGHIVVKPSEDWSTNGPNASFAAVTLYRTNQVRQIAELEVANGTETQDRSKAKQIISATQALEKEVTAALKNHGVARSTLKVPMPNLYAKYGALLKSMKSEDPSLVQTKFRSKFVHVEQQLRRQVQVDAMQVASRDLAKATSLAASLSVLIIH